jgi:hypothetical protein
MGLSPLLSVLPLIVLDDLEEVGIKHVLYCDDGIFYSDTDIEHLSIAQAYLNKHNIGAFFNYKKSFKVKHNGQWIAKIKFCGLLYDPFKDSLSADTRNGATLELNVGSLAYFSQTKLGPAISAPVSETSTDDWSKSNRQLFDSYERMYLTKGFGEAHMFFALDNLAKCAHGVMRDRLNQFNSFTFPQLIRDSQGSIDLPTLLAPIRLL